MKRLSWSKFFNLTALLSLGLVTTVTSANGASVTLSGPIAGRSPVTADVGARVPSTDPNSGALKAWEGFQTTNYLSTEPYTFSPPTAGIAAGPVNVLTVVNRRVAMFDNPNAILSNATPSTSPTNSFFHSVPGTTAFVSPSNPGITSFVSQFPPSSEALLDAMLGEAVLGRVCPTAPRTTISCLIENATVRYDQMHGRFLIGMTVTDTGIQTPGGTTTSARKASWVLIISNFSQFPVTGQTATSDLFICTSGSAANCSRPGLGTGFTTGGLNLKNWAIYYGDASGDGFGGAQGAGNINDIPAVSATAATTFNCAVNAIGSTNAVCYFPTSLRIGIDNDNIVLASAVVNTNLTGGVPQFAGTRVRVIKKGTGSPGTTAGIYQKAPTGTPLAAGPMSPTSAASGAGDYVDVYATMDAAQLAPLTAAQFSTFGWSPFTIAPPVTTANLAPVQGIFCEPERVRGRAQASYTNSMLPAGATTTSQTYLACIISTPPAQPNVPAPPQTSIFIQPIQYTVTNFGFAVGTANVNSAVRFGIGLPAGFDGTAATMQVASVPAFFNPLLVPQAQGTGVIPPPGLYVGDDRPHELVMREGYLYDARVGTDTASVITAGGTQQNATVYYDILQKLTLGASAAAVPPVLLARWGNTDAYAPEYEVPANVTTQGQTSPINTFNWLEKLFVATTYPPLAGSDPRLLAFNTAGSPSSGQASNVAPGGGAAGSATAVPCVSSLSLPNTVGGVSNVVNGVSTTARSFAGLFDQRCGDDEYDTPQSFRDPVSGAIVNNTPALGILSYKDPGTGTVNNNPQFVSIGVRGSASTDPNNGGLWNFGLYAARRFSSIQGFGQIGSYVSNYDLAFPTTDPYGNSTALAKDCAVGCGFFVPVQIALNQGLAVLKADGTVGINDAVSRGEMARLTVLGMMDEKAIQAFLQNTGGCTTSFADVASDCNGGVSGGVVPAAATTGSFWRYIETMARKRITTGCFANDATQRFCPNDSLTRAQMAVFLIRAKMNNVFPSVISGCPSPQAPACPGVTGGDNFGLTVGTQPYFTDVTSAGGDPFAAYFLYIQKMYELRITNGIAPPPSAPAYGPGQTLTRGQLLTFIVRAFFY